MNIAELFPEVGVAANIAIVVTLLPEMSALNVLPRKWSAFVWRTTVSENEWRRPASPSLARQGADECARA